MLKSGQLFSPEFRLHFPWEYKRFFGVAEVLRLPDVLIFRIPNDQGFARLGMTVKSSSGSVERNKAKRLIREFFRKNHEKLGSYDYNFVIPGTKRIDFQFRRRLGCCLNENLGMRIQNNKDEKVFEASRRK